MRLALYAAGFLLLAGSAFAAPPTTIQDPTNVNRNLAVNADGSINVSGSISATNPSVGTNGAAAPTSSTATGYQDGSGNLTQDSTTNPHPVTCISGCSSTGVAQGSTTSGQTVTPIGCRTLAALPTDTTAKTNMPACTTSGELSTHDASVLAAINGAVPAGTNLIGKVGIDQTTPGTTNNVTLSTNVGTLPLVQATASAAITFTAAGGPTQIIGASGSTKIYVTHIHYVLSGAGTFALVTGTGTNCGTGTAYLEGASGHPLSYAANGGISAGSGLGPIYVTGAGGEVCAITTGAVDISGVISYAQF